MSTTTLGTHALRRATRRAASCSERTELLPLLLLRPAACCSAPTSRAPRRSLRTSAPRALTVSPKTPGGSNGTSQESFPPPSFPAAFGENQLVPLPASVVSRLASLHSSFRAPLRFAFAYGSGVFAQHAGPEHSRRPEGPKGKMVDIVMAVAHPEHWHAVNMQQHPGHYSRVARLLGSGMMARVQRLGAGIWYNPYVKVGDELVKYGVISVDDLCTDLLDWETLYVSGRMHKPVAMMQSDARVRLAQQVNLTSALRVALLLLPEKFTEVELYTRIASLSYVGDFRMRVPGGENADKVRNIVLGQRQQFRRLYAGLLRSIGNVQIEEARKDRFAMTQDISIATRASYAAKLPLRLREKLQSHYTSRPGLDPSFLSLSLSRNSDVLSRRPSDSARAAHLDSELLEAFWKAAVKQADFHDVLLAKIAETVRGPAWSQSVKGVYTAGLTRTLKYVGAKIGKYFEGRKERSEKAQAEKTKEKQ